MDHVRAVLDAIEVFFDNLAAVHFGPLALAVLCHVLKLLAATRAWRNIVADAYPDREVRWRPLFGAFTAGVGINAILPARGGDVAKLYLAKRSIPGSTYTTLTSTLLVQSIFDFLMASVLVVWAIQQGALPGLDVLPNLPSFDFSWFFAHPQASAGILAALFVGFVMLAIWLEQHVTGFHARLAQGFHILSDRPRYLRRVALWQTVDWALRVTTVYFFLLAADQSRRHRHRAGFDRVRPLGRGRLERPAQPERRDAADADGRQRRARLRGALPDAADVPVPEGRGLRAGAGAAVTRGRARP
jgi:hypothetical protein